VRQVTVLDGPGHDRTEAALESTRRFRFRPTVANGGRAVPVKIGDAYRFLLERSHGDRMADVNVYVLPHTLQGRSDGKEEEPLERIPKGPFRGIVNLPAEKRFEL
jgi:hypothetical protein